MKSRYLFALIILVMSFTSCITVQKAMKPDSAVSGQGSYMAGSFSGMLYEFYLVNLDNDDITMFEFKPKDYIQMAPVPVGRYALVAITGEKKSLVGTKYYSVEVPLEMMKIVHLNPNQITYLGDFEEDRREIDIVIDLNEAFVSLQAVYNFDQPMDIVPF